MTDLLALAVVVAREAGAVLLEEFHRPGGPRGGGDHADVDVEVERVIRKRLLEGCPGSGFLGEETGSAPGSPVWVVDPNDGTRDYLQGLRGSAVSIGLVQDGRPLLGVVFSPTAPDGDGDLLAWEEGKPSVRRAEPYPVVLTSRRAERRLGGNLARLQPYRVRTQPSLAYRLALVAAGDAAAATAIGGCHAWDIAGGHALLLSAGQRLLGPGGQEIRYGADGRCDLGGVFAASPDEALRLSRVDWAGVRTDPPVDPPFVIPGRGRAHRDAARLRRAQGCLLGQHVGDALGSLVEFQTKEDIRKRHPKGVRELLDGGTWGTIAGQPTDDSEMALALARTIARTGEYRSVEVLEAYRAWCRSGPFDMGMTTRSALEDGNRNFESQANGSLMRASPLGIRGWNRPDAAATAREDSALTHPHAVCQDACAAYVAAIGAGIREGTPKAAYEAALAAAGTGQVAQALRQAASRPPDDYSRQQGWVLLALQNAFFRLLHEPSFEEALVATVGEGGDTDTNAAIAGALLGSVHGREAIPYRWRLPVLTCRPLEGLPEVHRPRPRIYWPVDLLELAEVLLEG